MCSFKIYYIFLQSFQIIEINTSVAWKIKQKKKIAKFVPDIYTE